MISLILIYMLTEMFLVTLLVGFIGGCSVNTSGDHLHLTITIAPEWFCWLRDWATQLAAGPNRR